MTHEATVTRMGDAEGWFVVWMDRKGALRASGVLTERQAMNLGAALDACIGHDTAARGREPTMETLVHTRIVP